MLLRRLLWTSRQEADRRRAQRSGRALPAGHCPSPKENEQMRKFLIFAMLAVVVLLAIVQFGPAIFLGG